MTLRKSIRERLENWGRANRSHGGEGASCMTGLICDRLRKAALGNVWSGMHPHEDFDEKDAQLVNNAWAIMPNVKQKKLLQWYFVKRSNPDFICRRFGIKVYPASAFELELWRACDAIEQILDKVSQRNTIPLNNLIPSEKIAPSVLGGAAPKKNESLD